MQDNPRVGLILMRSNNLSCAQPEQFRSEIQSDEQVVMTRLSDHFEILGPWIVDSPEALQNCQRTLRDTDLDMIVLAYQTWAEDSYLVSLLPAVGTIPLVVWCYLPWRRLPHPALYSDLQRTSGLVGTFAALGTLHNLGTKFLFTFGAPDDPRLVHDLTVAGRAARLRQSLRKARFGLIPSRTDQMQCTFVDEYRLMADLGPEVEYIPVEDLRQAAEQASAEDVAGYLSRLSQRFPAEGVADETLRQAARAALGLARIADKARLDLLAIDDTAPELHQAFGMRPALYPLLSWGDKTPAGDLLPAGDTLYQPEGDLGAATANYILHHLTGSPTMFMELYFWDEPRNQLIGGHGGLQNPALADPRGAQITPDFAFCPPGKLEGAQMQFIARPGRITLLQLRSVPRGWQAMALSGMCLESQPCLEGFPHAILRLDAPVEHFLNRAAAVGVTQRTRSKRSARWRKSPWNYSRLNPLPWSFTRSAPPSNWGCAARALSLN
jgi:hypothetical protein